MFAVIRLGIIGVCSREAGIIPLDMSCSLGADVAMHKRTSVSASCIDFLCCTQFLHAVVKHPGLSSGKVSFSVLSGRRDHLKPTLFSQDVFLFLRRGFFQLSACFTDHRSVICPQRRQQQMWNGRTLRRKWNGSERRPWERCGIVDLAERFRLRQTCGTPCHVIDDYYLSSDFVLSTSSIKNTSEPEFGVVQRHPFISVAVLKWHKCNLPRLPSWLTFVINRTLIKWELISTHDQSFPFTDEGLICKPNQCRE